MQNKVHDDIDGEAKSGNNEHNVGVLHINLINNAVSSFINQKESKRPNNKQIADSSQQLEAMIAKGHLLSGLSLAAVDEHKRQHETNQICDEMKCITKN